MSKKKFTESLGNKGYYIALILCAVAIGISGYLYYRNANKENQQDQSVIATDPASTDVQAVATQPLNKLPDPTEPSQSKPTEPVKKPSAWKRPVDGQTVCGYAMDALCYNQTTRDWRTHNGWDIAAEAGTSVVSVADGKVESVFEDDTMGMTVVIRHEGGYVTTYASLDAQVKVKAGESVTAGQAIGCVGNTALLENAIGDHLHFTVTCNGEAMDPDEIFG